VLAKARDTSEPTELPANDIRMTRLGHLSATHTSALLETASSDLGAAVMLGHVPLGIWYLADVTGHGLVQWRDWLFALIYLAAFTGIVMQLIGFRLLASTTSPYRFAPEEMGRFDRERRLRRIGITVPIPQLPQLPTSPWSMASGSLVAFLARIAPCFPSRLQRLCGAHVGQRKKMLNPAAKPIPASAHTSRYGSQVGDLLINRVGCYQSARD
jgi:hypothetical protein